MPPLPLDLPHRQCTLVVAAAGYGKTTALGTALAGARWCREPAVDALIAGGLKELAAEAPQWIIVDNLAPMPAESAKALLNTAMDLPEHIAVVLSSRWPLDAGASPWRGRGALHEIRPGDLALDVDTVATLLASDYGLTEPSLPLRVHEITAGWPALVHLAAETMRTGGVPSGALLPDLVEPGTPLASYVDDEILGPLSPPAARLLREAGEFAPLSAGLCATLGHRRAPATLTLLSRTGLLTGVGRRIVPVIAAAAGRHDTRRGGPRPRAAVAATWYAENGPPLAAARAFQAAGDPDRSAAILADRGEDILGSGGASALVEMIEGLPSAVRHADPRLGLLLGDALRTAGDVVAAQRAYLGAADALEPDDPGVAWRLGLVHYLRNEPRAALAAVGRARPGAATIDDALVLAWTAAAQVTLGDVAAATDSARRAGACADATGDDRARATAHITLALCLSLGGDPAGGDNHYAQALRIADRIHDLLLVTRVHINRTYRLLGDARYGEALATARLAVSSAGAAGHVNLLTIATCNEARALARLGRYDEALERYERVTRMFHRLGSRRAAFPLVLLGEVHARRGWCEQARAAFEEAVQVARASGDDQALALALAGLARVLVPEDPAAAAAHADEAVARAARDTRVPALLGQGWVAARQGDLPRAAALAGQAAQLARGLRERAGLAEALELRAAVDTEPAGARAALVEALAIWQDGGAIVDADRVLVALGRLPGATTDDRLGALLARERLGRADVSLAAPPGAEPENRPVTIQVLGRFEVLLHGQPVPPSAWQSRKARDLLRILVARRGRPLPRPELAELLWPDDDPAKTGHRLSVLLSIVRTALDPGRAVPADHFVVADQSSVALDVSRLKVDAEDFLADVRHALALRDRGARAGARALLAAAERAYTDDPFADEPYADWTRELREEARAAYLRAMRALAGLSRDAGDTEQALHCLRQILVRDPYDEAAHRDTVAALTADGRHGEAQRAFERYVEAMREIGVPPPPAGLLATHRSRTP